MLSVEEERDLARRSSAGDLDATERLLSSHFRFVISLARKYRGSGVSFADLVQEGMIGLSHALHKFDPETRDNRFATYAMWWVRAAMQDYVVRSWSMVRIGTTTAQKALFLALRKKLTSGADLTDELAQRLATHFATPLAEVRALASRISGHDASLDHIGRPEGGRVAWVEQMADPAPTPEDIAAAKSEARHLSQVLRNAMETLSPRERLIIAKRHLSDLAPSLESLAREMQLSKERVRVLEKKALEKLRQMVAPHRPQE